jgi:hypothetical protein
MTSIVEYFNPYNVEHLKAYKVLAKTGMWPEDFIPKSLDNAPTLWQVALVNKMADAWVEQAEVGHIIGMPSFDQK